MLNRSIDNPITKATKLVNIEIENLWRDL